MTHRPGVTCDNSTHKQLRISGGLKHLATTTPKTGSALQPDLGHCVDIIYLGHIIQPQSRRN